LFGKRESVSISSKSTPAKFDGLI